MKENVRELRQAQREQRDKREEESRPPKELYKLSQFKDVESRLYATTDRLNRRPSMEGKEFLTRGVSESRRDQLALEQRMKRLELERSIEEAKHYSSAAQPVSPRKPEVPKEKAQLAPPSNADFISRNKVKAMTMVASRPHSDGKSSGTALHEEFGRVPEYLEERKARWAEEQSEKRRNAPDPNCPPGMCLMPDAERRNTLQVLQTSREEALAQLRRLPFVIETPSQVKRQEMLESKLREIDNAVGIFSKEKVYVAK
jgi:hypothetical protein